VVIMQRDENGVPTLALVSLMVITERKNAEAALRASEEKFRSIAEISPDIIYIYTYPNNEILYINKDEIIGHTVESLKQNGGFKPFIHPDDMERVEKERESMYAGDENYARQTEYRLLNAQGEWEWLQNRI